MQLFLGLTEELEALHRDTVGRNRQAHVEVRTNPTNAIRSAREGDFFVCSALCDAIRAQELPAEVLPEALEMFTTHITNGCPPDKVPFHNLQLADTSFSALASALLFQLPDMEDPPLRSVVRAWPSIIEWTRARIIQDIRAFERLPARPEETWILLGVFLDGIQKLRKHKELQIVVIHDPRVLELAVHCFHAPDVLPGVHFPVFGLGIIDFYIETNAVHSKEAIDVPWRKALDELLSVVQGRPELLLDPILGLLDRSIHDGNLAILTMLACSEILGKLVAIRGHPFAVAMEERGLTTLSRMLGFLTSITPATKRSDELPNVFTLCLGIFSAFSTPLNRRTWILKALQHRIFHSLCTYGSYVSRTYEERISAIKRLLTPNLSAHLVDPSVIYACEDALSMLSAEHHEQIMGLPIAPAWKSFINRFFEQYVFYCYFDVVGYHKGCFKCGVVAKSGKNALRKCGACKLVDYCSSDCQLSDWKEHKKECKELKGKKYPPLPRFAKASFRKRLAAHDARRHLPGVRVYAAQKHPCFPLQCMCVLLGYNTFPPLLCVALSKELGVDNEQLLKDASDPLAKESCFDDIRLHDGSYSILEMLEYNEERQVVKSAQAFHWSPPYFSSKYGTQCPDMYLRSSAVMPYADEEGRDLATAWSVVDEIAYRGKLSPQMIFDGKIGDIRRKVLEVIVREKARMQVGRNGVDAVCS